MPLNPSLYNLLTRKYGRVVIANEGEAQIPPGGRPYTDIDGSQKLFFDQTGEYYRLDCPYCRDTKKRLWVNYMFGEIDAHDRRANQLAVCYNENCLDDFQNRYEFVESLQSMYVLGNPKILPGKVLSEAERQIQPPGKCVPLHALPALHHANVYLRSRGFDPEQVARTFGVCWCEFSDYYLARDRIIIPVVSQGKLRGWQARHIGELPWKDPIKKKDLPPKYFTCPGSKIRSQHIYRWDFCKQWETAIIVEGPTDVWRFGGMSGCIFGNTMTQLQTKKFLAAFRDRSGVLLLDPEEFDKDEVQKKVREVQQAMPKRFCAVRLPEGSDPGSLDREFQREYVRREAAKQGVQVIYRKAA